MIFVKQDQLTKHLKREVILQQEFTQRGATIFWIRIVREHIKNNNEPYITKYNLHITIDDNNLNSESVIIYSMEIKGYLNNLLIFKPYHKYKLLQKIKSSVHISSNIFVGLYQKWNVNNAPNEVNKNIFLNTNDNSSKIGKTLIKQVRYYIIWSVFMKFIFFPALFIMFFVYYKLTYNVVVNKLIILNSYNVLNKEAKNLLMKILKIKNYTKLFEYCHSYRTSIIKEQVACCMEKMKEAIDGTYSTHRSILN